MRTIRIHLNLALAAGTEVPLPGQAAEHVVRVLRLGVGDDITLFNGDGNDYQATILAARKHEVRLLVTTARCAATESPLALTLAQAVVRGEKMDWIVQKAAELGVGRILPLLTERTQVRMDPLRAQKRLAHWQTIAASACEQCGRARVPEVAATMELPDWLRRLPADSGQRLALLPGAQIKARELDFTTPRGTLVVGPEGGLGDRDLRMLQDAGFTGLSLGPRILRTETAGLAALAALQSLHGDC